MPNVRDQLIEYSALKCFMEKDSPSMYDFIVTMLDSCERRDELMGSSEESSDAAA